MIDVRAGEVPDVGLVNAMSTVLGHTAAYGGIREQTNPESKVPLSSTGAY